jgi:chromosome segregation ATPase
VYEKRMGALTDRATSLESRVEKLEGVIECLRLEVEERDDMIDTLQRENAQLKQENDCKDRKITKLQTQVRELQTQVATLTARLDAMNSKGGNA